MYYSCHMFVNVQCVFSVRCFVCIESGLSILDNAIVPLWEFKVHWTMQPINCACVLHEITCCVKAVNFCF